MIGGLVYTYLDHRLGDLVGLAARSRSLPAVLRTPLAGAALHPRGAVHPRRLLRAGRARARMRRRHPPRGAAALEEAARDEDRVGVGRASGAPVLLMHGLGYTRGGWGPLRERPRRAATACSRSTTAASARARSRPGRTRSSRAGRRRGRRCSTRPASTARTWSARASAASSRRSSRLDRPERVDRLVLACTSPGGPERAPAARSGRCSLMAEAPSLAPEVALRRFVENALAPATVAEHRSSWTGSTAYRLAHGQHSAGVGCAGGGRRDVGRGRPARSASRRRRSSQHGDRGRRRRPAERRRCSSRSIPDAHARAARGTAATCFFWEAAERVRRVGRKRSWRTRELHRAHDRPHGSRERAHDARPRRDPRPTAARWTYAELDAALRRGSPRDSRRAACDAATGWRR